jgi:hypothetical protein
MMGAMFETSEMFVFEVFKGVVRRVRRFGGFVVRSGG